MSRQSIKPERVEAKNHLEEYSEHHPAYCMIRASRVQHGGTGAALAGSDFRHNGYVSIEINHAHLSRELSNDRWYPDNGILRVSLSEAQWATFVSTLNYGSGVPCTLEHLIGEMVPGIESTVNRREQFGSDVRNRLSEALKSLDELIEMAPNKKTKEKAERARMQIVNNIDFVVEQFDEHAEKMIKKAKLEVEAYMAGTIQRAGIAAMNEKPLAFIENNPEP